MPGDIAGSAVADSKRLSLVDKAAGRSAIRTTIRSLDDFAGLSSECFWEMDTSFRYTYLSGRFSEITGIPRTIALGMTNAELGLTFPTIQTRRAHQSLLENRNSFRENELRYIHPDGRELHISASGEAIYDQSGRFSGYRGSARKLEFRADLPGTNQKAQAFYQLAGRVADLGFWEWDEIADKCAFCSEELARVHGVTVGEFLSCTVTNADDRLWIHPDDRERYETAVRSFRENLVGFEIEYRLVRADKRIADVIEVVAPIVDSNGQLIRSFGLVKDISESKRAAKELERISRVHRQTASLAMIGHWEWDEVEDRCMYCDDEMAQLHGLTVDEYLVQAATLEGDCELVHPADRTQYVESQMDYLHQPRRVEYEFRLLAGHNKIRDVREVLEPVFDEANRHIKTIGFLQDISAAKKAAASLEQARNEMENRVERRTEELQRSNDKLRESQARLRDATRIAKLGYFKWDTINDRGIYGDDEYAQIVGVPAADCMKETLEDYVSRVHYDDVARVIDSYRTCKANRLPTKVEYRVVHANGDIRHVQERSAPRINDDGVVIQTFGTVQDITERKLASEELLQVEERLHELGANAREVLYVLSADWQRVIYVNEAFEHIWGLSCQAVIENPRLWMDAVHPDDRKTIASEIHAKSGSDEWNPNFSDCRVIGVNGELHWLSTRMYPIRDGNGEIVRLAGVVEDITERKEATDALHQVQKMDAVGQLTGGVAHDFNNLLAVILGNARLLEGRVPPNEEPLLQDIITAGDRGAELTRRLLAFSRLQPLQPKPTDVTKLTMEIGGLLRRTLGSTITVDISSTCTSAMALVDPGLLENAILNLSINARDAMPRGGRLIIRVEDSDPLAPLPPGKVGLSRALQVVVQDNGIGMDKEVSSRSLEPFFTTKAPGEGSGLGLPMVYGFVKQSNGDLLVDSKPNIGTVVTIRLPCLESSSELPG